MLAKRGVELADVVAIHQERAAIDGGEQCVALLRDCLCGRQREVARTRMQDDARRERRRA